MPPKASLVARNKQLQAAREAKRSKSEEQSKEIPNPIVACGDAPMPSEQQRKEQETVKSASRSKLERMRQDPDMDSMEQVWCLAHTTQLSRLICDVLCPNCFEDGLTIQVVEGENQGFATKLELVCRSCDSQLKRIMSSPRQDDSSKANVPFELNTRMTVFSHEVGKSYGACDKFGTVMGIPVMHLNCFQSHDKRITGMWSFSTHTIPLI